MISATRQSALGQSAPIGWALHLQSERPGWPDMNPPPVLLPWPVLLAQPNADAARTDRSAAKFFDAAHRHKKPANRVQLRSSTARLLRATQRNSHRLLRWPWPAGARPSRAGLAVVLDAVWQNWTACARARPPGATGRYDS